jgi:hypothetical protein
MINQHGPGKDGWLTLPGQFAGGYKQISPLRLRLYKLFERYVVGNYLKTLHELCIILRVSGPITDFDGGDGPELLRFQKKERYMKIDLVIPQSKWDNIPPEEIKLSFTKGVCSCFHLLIQRAEKEGELLDKESFVKDFNKCIALFLTDADINGDNPEEYDNDKVQNILTQYQINETLLPMKSQNNRKVNRKH